MRTYHERIKYAGYEFEVDYTKEDGIYIESVGLIYEDYDPKWGTFKNPTEDIHDLLAPTVVHEIYRRIEGIELEKDKDYEDYDR